MEDCELIVISLIIAFCNKKFSNPSNGPIKFFSFDLMYEIFYIYFEVHYFLLKNLTLSLDFTLNFLQVVVADSKFFKMVFIEFCAKNSQFVSLLLLRGNFWNNALNMSKLVSEYKKKPKKYCISFKHIGFLKKRFSVCTVTSWNSRITIRSVCQCIVCT